jgi:hypothetical protein
MAQKRQKADFLLICALNAIINDFLKRVFSGPNAFFLVLCTQSVASARKMSPGFWPLTSRRAARINHDDGATKFGPCGGKYSLRSGNFETAL